MLKIVIPDTQAKIQQQIEALEYLLTQDTREKDRKIHQQALEALKNSLKNK